MRGEGQRRAHEAAVLERQGVREPNSAPAGNAIGSSSGGALWSGPRAKPVMKAEKHVDQGTRHAPGGHRKAIQEAAGQVSSPADPRPGGRTGQIPIAGHSTGMGRGGGPRVADDAQRKEPKMSVLTARAPARGVQRYQLDAGLGEMTPAERAARGKEARAAVPRDSHAVFDPRAGPARPDRAAGESRRSRGCPSWRRSGGAG